jgi:hypothetical protein
MAFYVGQKVVCVDAGMSGPNYGNGHAYGLREGAIYVIVAARPSKLQPNVDMLRLDGISGAWLSSRFRPVVEDADKLEWARQLVAPKAKDRELVS